MSKFNIDGQKLQYHLDRVHQWKYGDRASVFPIYVEISPVGHCNHRCTFCAVDYIGYVNRAIPTERLEFVIQDMANHGVRSIMYAGEGEPLLHPDIAQLVVWTKKNGMDVALTTNAVALTPKFCHVALDSCSWIKVSCNAGNAEAYSAIHKTNNKDWDRVWSNIDYALGLRFNSNSTVAIGVQCVLLPENEDTIIELARQCKYVGVDYLVIKPYSQHLKSHNTKHASVQYSTKYDQLFSDLQQFVSSKFEIVVRKAAMDSWDEADRKHDYEKCYSTPMFWAYIMANGDVYGCSAYLQDDRFKYGNIEEDLFSDIWMGEKRLKAIEFVEKELDITECRKNCRMHQCNKFLWEVENGVLHKNFV